MKLQHLDEYLIKGLLMSSGYLLFVSVISYDGKYYSNKDPQRAGKKIAKP